MRYSDASFRTTGKAKYVRSCINTLIRVIH